MDLEQKILKLLSVQMEKQLDRLEPFRSCAACHETVASGGLCSCDIEKGTISYGKG